MDRKQFAIIGGVVVLCALAVLAFVLLPREEPLVEEEQVPVVEEQERVPRHQVIGISVEGREIEAYAYGNGDTHLVFIGGIHGGYEWNSTLLAHMFMDYLEADSSGIPENITVSVIPVANPDGLHKIIPSEGRFALADTPSSRDVTIPGRFNANGVDLNRNFDCKWQPQSTWRSQAVSAGTAPFSEPEAQAIRDFVLEYEPDAVVSWHSQANAVYAGSCHDGVSSETSDILHAYARAANYMAFESFDAYEVTGPLEGWLATLDIPSLTVELQSYNSPEWERNLAGIQALFAYYGDE